MAHTKKKNVSNEIISWMHDKYTRAYNKAIILFLFRIALDKINANQLDYKQ